MAKKKDEKITPEGIRRAMEQDKDKIEAALAGAVTNADGSHPPAPRQMVVEEPKVNLKTEDVKDASTNGVPEQDTSGDIEMSANDVFLISSQNPDTKIRDHIKSLNNRIKSEAMRGGFSTNVTFTVIQNDWVNIQHILDWYRAHGFQILGFEQSTPPYGRNAGNIQYNFTISWANPA